MSVFMAFLAIVFILLFAVFVKTFVSINNNFVKIAEQIDKRIGNLLNILSYKEKK